MILQLIIYMPKYKNTAKLERSVVNIVIDPKGHFSATKLNTNNAHKNILSTSTQGVSTSI